MNGQLFYSYCANYGEDLDLCEQRKARNCVVCPYCKWILRERTVKEEQSNNNSES